MEAVRAGDARKLSILFDRHHAALYRFYVRMTGDRARSEDLVQEVFWRILRYRDTYQTGAMFTAWMYRIARNAHHDEWRKRKREVPIADEWEAASAEGLSLERRQQIGFLREALLRLPAAKREVLVLHRFQGMKYDEIAGLQGCEVNTIKVRAHRALKELRALYEQLTGVKHDELRASPDADDGLPFREPERGWAPGNGSAS